MNRDELIAWATSEYKHTRSPGRRKACSLLVEWLSLKHSASRIMADLFTYALLANTMDHRAEGNAMSKVLADFMTKAKNLDEQEQAQGAEAESC